MAPPWNRLPADLDTNRKWSGGSFAEISAQVMMKDIPLSDWAVYHAFDTAAQKANTSLTFRFEVVV